MWPGRSDERSAQNLDRTRAAVHALSALVRHLGGAHPCGRNSDLSDLALSHDRNIGPRVAAWAAAHHDRLVATQVLYTVGVASWFVFAGAVWTCLRNRLPASSPLAAGFGVGFVGCATLILSGFTVFDLLLYRSRSAELSTLLYDLAFGLLAMSGIPTVVALGCFAAAVYRHHVLRRSTAHVAAVAAAGHVLRPVAFIAPAGPLSMQGFMVVWGIPLLLFAWIGHTAQAITSRVSA